MRILVNPWKEDRHFQEERNARLTFPVHKSIPLIRINAAQAFGEEQGLLIDRLCHHTTGRIYKALLPPLSTE